MEITTILAPIYAIIGGIIIPIIAAAFFTFLQRRKKQKLNELQEYFSSRYMTAFKTNYDKLLEEYAKELQPDSIALFNEYRNHILRELPNMLAQYPVPSEKMEIEAEVKLRIDEMNKRIETIEARLPEEATLDKLESVNDAILATQIDALTKSVKDLKENMLTKWDVAIVVFAILGALSVIIGIIFGILNVIQK